MSFDVGALDYGLLVPQFILLGLIFLTWLLDLMLPRRHARWIAWVSVAGLCAALVAAALQWGVRASFGGVLRIDEYSVFFTIVFLLMAIGVTLISPGYARRFLPQPGEYYGLVLAGTLGMILMASANELLTAYLALELLSFSSYVLVSYAKTNLKSNEAGLKYIILGAFSSALLLYGISLLYGTLGTTYFPDIATTLSRLGALPPGLMVGLVLITSGMAFKVAAVPFHMWTPDVYEGAPTPITAYLSVGSKAAGFALVLRFVVGALLPIRDQWQPVFVVLALLTMTLGNLVAIQQRNVKRMLAYSSIAQAGYVLVGLAAISQNPDVAEQATRAIMLFLVGYVFTNLAAFGAIIAFQNLHGGRERIADLAGFARRAPFVGVAMMAALFSLAGMPLFAGFVTKFYLFAAAARAELLWLVAIAVINSTISLYYYLLVLYQMYVAVPEGFPEPALAHPTMDTLGPAVPEPLPVAYAALPARAGAVALATATGDSRPPAAAALAGAGYAAAAAQGGAGANGHAVQVNGHGSVGALDASGGHGGHGGGAQGPGVPWWRRSITADMPPEQSYPQHRIPFATTAALALFLAGIFLIGLWPAPIMEALHDASGALFGG